MGLSSLNRFSIYVAALVPGKKSILLSDLKNLQDKIKSVKVGNP